MNDFRQFSTERLSLRAVRVRDANQIFWLNSDPRVWAHRPSGVHTSSEQTEAQVTGYIAAWDRDGLGCWAARTHDGTFVGIGGCSVKDGIGWNVYYRFLPEVQGRGYEAELVRAAVIAASVVRPELPIVALVLEHNAPSRAAAENAGLTEVWRGPEEGPEDARVVRLVYADRELPPDVVETLQSHSTPRPADPPQQQARAVPDPVPPVLEEPRPSQASSPPGEPPDDPPVSTLAQAPRDSLDNDPQGLQAWASQAEAGQTAASQAAASQAAASQAAASQAAASQAGRPGPARPGPARPARVRRAGTRRNLA